jgi:hypothetical protein
MSETNGVVTKPNFAQAWKKNAEAMLVEFPSGLKAEMTRPNAMSLMTSENNEIPDTFFNLLIEAQQTGKNPTEGMSAEQMKGFMRFMDMLAAQLAVEHFTNPRVVPGEASEDEINLVHVKAMDMMDKQFIVNWGMNGGNHVDLLKRFRQQQNQLVVAAQNGEGIR